MPAKLLLPVEKKQRTISEDGSQQERQVQLVPASANALIKFARERETAYSQYIQCFGRHQSSEHVSERTDRR